MDKEIYLVDLHRVGMQDIEQVGGKNASLGEMLQNLTQLGIQIPGGLSSQWQPIGNLFDTIISINPFTISLTKLILMK